MNTIVTAFMIAASVLILIPVFQILFLLYMGTFCNKWTIIQVGDKYALRKFTKSGIVYLSLRGLDHIQTVIGPYCTTERIGFIIKMCRVHNKSNDIPAYKFADKILQDGGVTLTESDLAMELLKSD